MCGEIQYYFYEKSDLHMRSLCSYRRVYVSKSDLFQMNGVVVVAAICIPSTYTHNPIYLYKGAKTLGGGQWQRCKRQTG